MQAKNGPGCRTWEQYEVHYLDGREDQRGHEITQDRSWCVLSPAVVNQSNIFIGCPSWGGDRTTRNLTLLVDAPEIPDRKGRLRALDPQQLWTFAGDVGDPQVNARLSKESRTRLQETLSKHIGSRNPRARRPLVGRVFWVDFLLPSGEPARRSDLLVLQRRIKLLTGIDWVIPRTTRLSCVCIASDEAVGSDDKPIMPFATFVPLMHLPGLNTTAVTVPARAGMNVGEERAAISPCLFSFDYLAEQSGGRRRLYEHGETGMTTWEVTSEELDAILDDVRAWMGLTPQQS